MSQNQLKMNGESHLKTLGTQKKDKWIFGTKTNTKQSITAAEEVRKCRLS